MLEIKVIHEWRPGHAENMLAHALMEGFVLMNDVVSRVEASVSNLAAAIDNQNVAIAEVATAIRNHPASTTDNGRLSQLADKLDNVTSTLNTSTAQLHGLAGEESNEDATGDSATPPDTGISGDGTLTSPISDAPAGDTPSGGDVGSPDAAGSDGSEGAGNVDARSTGEQSGDVSGSDGSSETTSGDGQSIITE